MFITKDCWNPVSTSDFYGKPSHPIQVKIMCVLFILGRGTDLDTVSVLSHISIGTLSSFSITLARKWPLCFTSTCTCQWETFWQLFFLYTLKWDFLDVWDVQIVYISIGIDACTMCCSAAAPIS